MRKRFAAIATTGWLVACGHGTPGAGGRVDREPADAGAAGVALRDAGATANDAQVAVVDAGPVFPAKFSRNRDHPPCDPRKPDRKNPNCCWGYDRCSRTDCYVAVKEVLGDGEYIVLDAGWEDGLIRSVSLWWQSENSQIIEEYYVSRITADVAYARCDPQANSSGLGCEYYDEILASGRLHIRPACWKGHQPERKFQPDPDADRPIGAPAED